MPALLSPIEARLFVEIIVASLGELGTDASARNSGRQFGFFRSAGYSPNVKRIPTARGTKYTRTSDGST
jgi:hypothetical protein